MFNNKTYDLDVKKMDNVTGGALAHLAYQEPEEIPVGNRNPEKETPLGNIAHPGFGNPNGGYPNNLPVSGPIPPIPQSRNARFG